MHFEVLIQMPEPPAGYQPSARFGRNVGHSVHLAANDEQLTATMAFTAATHGLKVCLALKDEQKAALDAYHTYSGPEGQELPDVVISLTATRGGGQDARLTFVRFHRQLDLQCLPCQSAVSPRQWHAAWVNL